MRRVLAQQHARGSSYIPAVLAEISYGSAVLTESLYCEP